MTLLGLSISLWCKKHATEIWQDWSLSWADSDLHLNTHTQINRLNMLGQPAN
jgi:hypothetical protein